MRKIILISLFLAFAAHGQALQRVAILNTEDDVEPPISNSELTFLAAKFREVANNILPKNLYGIMTSESIVERLGSQEQAAKICREATCLADLGRKVNADYIGQARVGRFGGNLTIKAELYNVASGNLIASFTGDSKNVHGLLSVLETKAPALFKNMPGTIEANATSPAAVQKAKPKMAAYLMGGKLKPNEIEMIETKISIPFVQNEQYAIIERSDPFLSKLAAEMKKQKDGSLDYSQIKSLGKQAGVRFVCLANIVEAFGLISVSARLIDTESEEAPKMAETEIKNLSEIGQAAAEIYKQISGEKTTVQVSPSSQSEQSLAALKCDEEKKKAKDIYDRCTKTDDAAGSFAKCAEEYQNQNIKAEQACRAVPAQAKPQAAVAPRAVAVAQPQPKPVVKSFEKKDNSYEDKPREIRDEKGMRLGTRAGFSWHSGFSANDFNYKYFSVASGLSFDAGLALNVPITNILRFDTELAFFYKDMPFEEDGSNNSWADTEFGISIPILLQLGNSFYFETGIQLCFPFKHYRPRPDMDFGIALGLGYMLTNGYKLTNFEIDFRTVIGMTDYARGYDGSVNQYGLGVSYFF